MKLWRRVFRWRTLFIAVAAVLALLLLALAALQTPWARSYVLGKIEAAVERETGLRLAVRSMSWNLLSFRLTLRGLTLGPSSGPLPPFLRAEAFVVQASPALVFKREPRFRKILLDRPVVEIAYGPGGASNLPVFAVNPAVPPLTRLPRFILEDGRVKDGRFVLDDPGSGLRIDQSGLGIGIRWTGGEAHALELVTTAPGSVESGRLRLPIDALRLEASFDRDDAVIRELAAASGASRISLHGRVADLLAPRLETQLTADVAGSDIREDLGLREAVAGSLSLRAGLSGPVSRLTIRGSLEGSGAGVGEWTGAEVRAEFAYSPSGLEFPVIEIASPDGDLSGKLDWRPGPGGGTGRAGADWTGVDLGRLGAAFGRPGRILSVSSGHVAAKWNGPLPASLEASVDIGLSAPPAAAGPEAFAAAGRILTGRLSAAITPRAGTAGAALSRLEATGRLAISGSGDLRLDAAASLGKDWIDVTALDLVYPGGAVSASGRLPLKPAGGALSLALKAPQIDLGRTAAFFGLAIPVGGTLAVEASASGTAEKPALEARVAGKDLAYGAAAIGAATLRASTSGDRLAFDLALPSYEASAGGEILLAPPYRTQGRLSVKALDLARLLPAALGGAPPPLKGRVSGHVDFRLALAEAGRTVRFEAEFPELVIGYKEVEVANSSPVRAAFDGRELAVEDLSLAGSGGSLEIEGAIPAAASAEGRLTVRAAIDLSLAGAFESAVVAQGRAEIAGTISGTLASPLVDMSAQVRGARLGFGAAAPPVEDLGLRLVVRDNRAEVEAAAFRWGKASASLTGSFPLSLLGRRFGRSAPAFSAHATVRELAFSSLGAALASPALEGLGGQASFDLDIAGSEFDWTGLTGRLAFGSLDLSAAGSSVSLRTPAEIVLDRGELRLPSLELAGSGTSFRLEGALDLPGAAITRLALRGSFELALLRNALGLGAVSGQSTVDLRASGPLARPVIEGTAGFSGVAMRIPDYGLSVSGLSGALAIEGETITLKDFKGALNRGTVELSGGARLAGFSLASADVRLRAVSVLTSYPQGVQAEWDLALDFTSDGDRHRLAGKASMVQGEYTEDFALGTGILGLLKSGGVRVYAERSPFLDHLAFDVNIVTANPFVIRNNVADAQVRAALKLGGTPYDPGLGGSVLVLDGSTVTFTGNVYQVERGRVDFVNPNRIEPNLDLQATTSVSGYSIRLTVTGTPENLRADFTSDPALPEADILALLTVGVPLQNPGQPSSTGLTTQALGYLEGALTGQIGKTIAKGLGLETLRLDTNLVAPGDTPEARLTVGQHLTPSLQLILSQDLRDANVRTVILNYALRPRLNLQAINTDSDTYRFSVQGRFRFGPSTPVPASLQTAPAARLRIGRIRFTGDPAFPEKTLRRRLKLKTGRRFRFLAYGRALRRLEDFYERSGRLDYVIKPIREEAGGRVDITLEIQAGPKYELVERGWALSRRLRRRVRNVWTGETFPDLRAADVESAVRAALCAKRYFQARVAARAEDAGTGARRIVIDVDRGIRFAKPRLVFEGNRAFDERRLRAVVGPKSLCLTVFGEPGRSASLLRDLYRDSGYLRARVDEPKVELDEKAASARIVFAIEEGPLFRIRDIRFTGASAIGEPELRKIARLAKGQVFRLEAFDQSRSRLQAALEAKGYIDASVRAEARPDPAASAVDLEFRLAEGVRASIAAIEISGNKATRTSFVREVLAVRPGDRVEYRKLNESRRNLYGLGVFRTLDIDLAPASGPAAEATPAPAGEAGTRAYDVKVDLSEERPFNVVGGVQYDSETSVGGNATLIYENFLGRALSLGASGLYDRLDHSARVFVRSQYLFGYWADTNLSVYYDRSFKPDFTISKSGVSLQQQRRFGRKVVLGGAYTFERDRTTMADGSPDERRSIGRLSLSLAYDSRDDFLNPTRGHFLAQTVEYGDRFLGSDVRYARSYGQASLYVRLAPFLLFASGARLGLGTGFGPELPPELRFFAGGSTTVRGYGFEELGPKDPVTGLAVGGDALLVLNEELRFPVYKILGGVVFLDLGNVYPLVKDFRPWSLRSGAGFGLRLSLGALVGRFDMGFKLAPRPGESRSAIYFSIGQAF
jgi:outer membrane protein assembly complex protein YaeT